jgi:hypothetical protein
LSGSLEHKISTFRFPRDKGLLIESLREAKASRPKRRGNLKFAINNEFEIAAAARGGLAMT